MKVKVRLLLKFLRALFFRPTTLRERFDLLTKTKLDEDDVVLLIPERRLPMDEAEYMANRWRRLFGPYGPKLIIMPAGAEVKITTAAELHRAADQQTYEELREAGYGQQYFEKRTEDDIARDDYIRERDAHVAQHGSYITSPSVPGRGLVGVPPHYEYEFDFRKQERETFITDAGTNDVGRYMVCIEAGEGIAATAMPRKRWREMGGMQGMLGAGWVDIKADNEEHARNVAIAAHKANKRNESHD